MRVFVYRNLHKKCYSIRLEKTRRVIDRQEHVIVADVQLVVGAKSRQRVLDTQTKNVHAGVRGNLSLTGNEAVLRWAELSSGPWIQIYYNPFVTETFICKESGTAVYGADLIFLTTTGAFAYLPSFCKG